MAAVIGPASHAARVTPVKSGAATMNP